MSECKTHGCELSIDMTPGPDGLGEEVEVCLECEVERLTTEGAIKDGVINDLNEEHSALKLHYGRLLAEGARLKNELDKWQSAAAEIEALRADIDASGGLKCPNCDDQGFWVDSYENGEPEQVQCEFCDTVPDSIFMRSTASGSPATLKKSPDNFNVDSDLKAGDDSSQHHRKMVGIYQNELDELGRDPVDSKQCQICEARPGEHHMTCPEWRKSTADQRRDSVKSGPLEECIHGIDIFKFCKECDSQSPGSRTFKVTADSEQESK